MIRILAILAASTAWAQSQESIEAQRRSVARQRDAIAQHHAREPAVEPASDCEPLAEDAVTSIVDGAAKARHLPAKLLRAVIAQESAFRPCAVSKKGAQGLMQLMPATAEQFEVDDPFDPKANVEAGAKFLRQLLDRYAGDLSLALAAYNAGPGVVDQVKGIPEIKETREYVEAILGKVGVKRIDPPSIPMPRPIEN